ncbi:MAG: c-type cytochrome, partial [Acidobacteria bacterium]|nr:c-type cytochrome [Acidobacteriota bacterium]
MVGVTLLVSFAAVLNACARKTAPTQSASLTPPFLETPVPPRPAKSAELVERGRTVYMQNCVQCHGETGKGDGFGAPFLVPPPRDFTATEYKFRSTTSGSLPTDEDLFRTISRGANGTGMPPWQYLLNDEDRWALVEYVKRFSPKFANGHAPAVVKLSAAPGSVDVKRGRAVYDKMQCAKCHGDDGRGMGPSALTLKDSTGRHVNSRDFTVPGSFRTGWTAPEIVRTLQTGMNGVPMPSYTEAMTTQDMYDVAAFVISLAGTGAGDQKRSAARSMAGLGTPDRVITLREHAWKYEPSE